MSKEKIEIGYQERVDRARLELEEVSKKSFIVSWIRVGLGVGTIVALYYALIYTIIFVVLFVMVMGFIYLVWFHEKLRFQKKYLQSIVTINERELAALRGDYTAFDDGSGFNKSDHPFAVDLDLFGKGSLFQRINRTCTETGKERLASMLSEPLHNVEEIRDRQKAVEEFASKIEFRQAFQAIGMTSDEKKDDQESLLKWLALPAMVYGKKYYRYLLYCLPLASAIGLIYWIIFGIYIPFAILTLIQWGIIGNHYKRVSLFQDYIGKKRFLLEKFSRHFNLLQKQSFKAKLAIALLANGGEASREIKRLASLSRSLDLRLNMFASTLLNATVLYDLRCVYKLEKWREENKNHLPQWLKAIEETDALSSMGGYVFNHPNFVFPQVEEGFHYEAEQLGHPLLPDDGRVCNDVFLQEDTKVWIVTGANMAGKSTFLRSVGLNMVMALSGLPVCARKMTCSLVEVYTGMRTTDSINENQSYFFAELLRLQMIMGNLRQGKKMLVLLDEILKGTNSGDKLAGSEKLIKQLVDFPSFTLVATHDVALGKLQGQYSRIHNYHFETFIQGDELSFDYLLKPGVSTGKNATFLMERMGIIK